MLLLHHGPSVLQSLRQDSNLRLGLTTGVCFQLTLRRRCGRMESNHHSQRHRVYSAASSPMLGVRGREDRPDSNRRREDHGLECCRYTTALT